LTESSGNPLQPFLDGQPALILDGGLATTLEDHGCDLTDELWSARILLEDPDAIGRVHREFLAAGADCITTATYQATVPGLMQRGLDPEQARARLDLAVELAVGARDGFWAHRANRAGRLKPLVAAGIGPYGAYLADGSEYRGQYGIPNDELRRFHQDRWDVLAAGRADLLACETLPCLAEALVLLDLLEDTPGRWAWFSFSCGDGSRLADGTPFPEAVRACDGAWRVAGIGVNCTAPEFIGPLLAIARPLTDKPLIVYPNSGELYDPRQKTWSPGPQPGPLARWGPRWVEAGARAVGGCCRFGPRDIAGLRRELQLR
jgi:homocysteine S-methyltransferase